MLKADKYFKLQRQLAKLTENLGRAKSPTLSSPISTAEFIAICLS
jgi:hypothetical protein